MRNIFAAAAVAASLAVAGAANAEFFPGQPVAINGAAGPQFGGTSWGTWKDQGLHNLGGNSQYFDATFGPILPVFVNSSFINAQTISFEFDFGGFFPGDFDFHAIDILGLKQDGSIIEVTASQGIVQTNGNDVHWDGSGSGLANEPDLKITVVQIPAPGALALLGVAGLAARRRRA